MATLTVTQRLSRRVRNYHCKGCGLYYSRRRKSCPDCRTPKGSLGYGPRPGSGFFGG